VDVSWRAAAIVTSTIPVAAPVVITIKPKRRIHIRSFRWIRRLFLLADAHGKG